VFPWLPEDVDMKITLFALALLLIASAAHAGRVGIVADHGSFVQTACVSYSGTKTAADVLRSSGLGVEMADYGGELGEAVCRIGATGCPSSNCFCQPEYWAFYYSNDGSSWTMSETGVSFHDVSDGEILGFSWTGWPPEEPEWRAFGSICPSSGAEQGERIIRHFSVNITGNETGGFCTDGQVRVHVQSVEDKAPVWEPSFDDARREVFQGAAVKVFHRNGWWDVVERGETNRTGYFEFLPDLAGDYSVEVSKTGFVHFFSNFEAKDCSMPECASDAACNYDEYCSQAGKCEKVAGYCGYAQKHKFVEYECCSDSMCSADSRCEDHRCVVQDSTRLKEIIRVLFSYYI